MRPDINLSVNAAITLTAITTFIINIVYYYESRRYCLMMVCFSVSLFLGFSVSWFFDNESFTK